MAAGSSASKAVLGLQTVNPNSLRRTAKLQASGQPSSSQGRRLGGLWVIDWLPWVRLFVISLLLLLLASAVLGRQLRQQQVLNNY
jgi:hypothetical protein